MVTVELLGDEPRNVGYLVPVFIAGVFMTTATVDLVTDGVLWPVYGTMCVLGGVVVVAVSVGARTVVWVIWRQRERLIEQLDQDSSDETRVTPDLVNAVFWSLCCMVFVALTLSLREILTSLPADVTPLYEGGIAVILAIFSLYVLIEGIGYWGPKAGTVAFLSFCIPAYIGAQATLELLTDPGGQVTVTSVGLGAILILIFLPLLYSAYRFLLRYIGKSNDLAFYFFVLYTIGPVGVGGAYMLLFRFPTRVSLLYIASGAGFVLVLAVIVSLSLMNDP
jgi:hypothetical protein